ncbi:hypothetical protein OK016_24910 [Vibrio chagasii]|nr:hypothetical protein [Vibrio chagasii]
MQFGLGLFTSLMEEVQIVAVMLLCLSWLSSVRNLLIPSIFVIAFGDVRVGFGKLDVSQVTLGLTTPVFIMPDFEFFCLVLVSHCLS